MDFKKMNKIIIWLMCLALVMAGCNQTPAISTVKTGDLNPNVNSVSTTTNIQSAATPTSIRTDNDNWRRLAGSGWRTCRRNKT